MNRRLCSAVRTLALGALLAGGNAACRDPAPPTAPLPSTTTSTTSTSSTTTAATSTTTTTSLPPLVVTDDARAQAQRGELPPGPELDVVLGKCAICHSTQYLTMQRLTPAQWEKTLKKMKGWGAPVDDAEVAALTRYLAAYFTPDLPAAPAIRTRLPSTTP